MVTGEAPSFIQANVLDESRRREMFPVCARKIFLSHAAVTALPLPVARAMTDYIQVSCENPQEFEDVLRAIADCRKLAAEFIHGHADEIALLGPTSLGLSLFANGIPWRQGDEILCYLGDYPANVYPWIDLRRRGVTVKYLAPRNPGEITPELVSDALSPRTRLVALASCNFLTGFRIDIDAIGSLLGEKGVLFSLDAIQTLGAFPVSVKHVDFLSADAHKWMLGPLAIGIVYVKKERFDLLRPTLLGAWNIESPNFITQDKVEFVKTARRYEPGALNVAGIYGMHAAISMLMDAGPDAVAARIVDLQTRLVENLGSLGFQILSPQGATNGSGIVTFSHPRESMSSLFRTLEKNGVSASLRFDSGGAEFIRLSPHFYNTTAELDQVVDLLKIALG